MTMEEVNSVYKYFKNVSRIQELEKQAMVVAISKKSAVIKGIKNEVAGMADVLLVPSVETGNRLVKMLIYFCGACAAGVVVGGKVPVVITSRSDEAQARLASIAAAVVALD